MYRGQEPQKKKRKRGKVAEFLLNAISGRHLLLSWRRWVGWLIVATIVAVAQLSQSGPLAHLVFFALSGLLWILPAMAIIKWLILEPRPKN